MIRTLIILFLALLITLSGCGKSNKGVVLIDGPAYLKLVGICEDISLQIDNTVRIPVVDDCEDTQFSVKPGLHVIKLYRDGVLVLERKVSLGANEICEVRLP